MIKAVALMSGGLDSSIAVHIMDKMNISIIGVHFTGPFCQCNRGAGGCINYARQQADKLGMEFMIRGLGDEYLNIVKAPRHGYGSAMNPCIDCRIMMFRKARELMEEREASFVFTGEVLGQRPMSQLKKKLDLIEKESGLTGLLLRPLSARHLPETIPEQKGWVDRSALLDIQGRQRKEQISLAESLAIGDYPCPAGGCLLTDKPFAGRLREKISHDDLTMKDIGRLKIGRHFRLPGGAKLILGKNEGENIKIKGMTGDNEISIEPVTEMGPVGLLEGAVSQSDINIACKICTSYCDGDGSVEILATGPNHSDKAVFERSARDTWQAIGV